MALHQVKQLSGGKAFEHNGQLLAASDGNTYGPVRSGIWLSRLTFRETNYAAFKLIEETVPDEARLSILRVAENGYTRRIDSPASMRLLELDDGGYDQDRLVQLTFMTKDLGHLMLESAQGVTTGGFSDGSVTLRVQGEVEAFTDPRVVTLFERTADERLVGRLAEIVQ